MSYRSTCDCFSPGAARRFFSGNRQAAQNPSAEVFSFAEERGKVIRKMLTDIQCENGHILGNKKKN